LHRRIEPSSNGYGKGNLKGAGLGQGEIPFLAKTLLALRRGAAPYMDAEAFQEPDE
jgi:hypothetical protein